MTPARRIGVATAAVLVAGGLVAAAVTFGGGGATAPRTTPSTASRVPSPTVTPAGGTGRTSSTPPTRSAPSPVPHVMVIVMENHGYGAIVGNPTAPYLNSLIARYGLATRAYATTHPSLPNYLALVSGSTQGITTDCTTTCTANGPQLVDQLASHKIGWHAYMESAPRACYTGSGAYPYDRHHDPFVYAPHIVDDQRACAGVVPLSTLAPALAHGSAPPFVWITPNVLHDMHTGSVEAGDSWLREELSVVLRSGWYRHDGVVVVTWDESTGGTSSGCCGGADGGHVATVVVSSRTRPGARLETPVDGAGILRTIEALYRLPYLGAADDPASGTLLPLLGMRRAAG